MTMQFNHADLFEGVTDAVGERTALVCGDRRLSYAELDAEANRLAHHMDAAGVRPGQHVGMQLYSGVEYAAALLATLKIRAVPVNVNYRYLASELEYIFRDANLVALLYDAEFAERVNSAAAAAPAMRHLIAVGAGAADAGTADAGAADAGAADAGTADAGTADAGTADAGTADAGTAGAADAGAALPGTVRYDEAVVGQPPTRGFPGRSPGDVYIIYTGGTTGVPKGVMWRTEDLFFAFGGGNPGGAPVASPQELVAKARAAGPVIMMPVAPLMHGAGQMAMFISFWMGGTVVFVRKFDASDVLATIEREKVMTINIVGDAMADPLADEIAAGTYDLSSLIVVSSTGAILSGCVRDRLQSLLGSTIILDNFGSTESGYSASGVAGATPESGLRYRPNDSLITVLGSTLEPVQPGSGEVGQIARSGHISLGYYNDPRKTAETYVTIDSRRWLLSGDLATVDTDGTIAVLGRGSQCINTGGEKVFPEEIEATLKAHPAVSDVIVTGIPDPRYGERVAAVVKLRAGCPPPHAGELDDHCRARLAGYKVPRAYAFVRELKRSPAGKADYRWAREMAARAAAGPGGNLTG
jgi:3-oxocholest-4-en-26-oate---CoA ligase